MPLVRITMIKGRAPEEKRRISDAAHQSLVEAFRIPETDYNHMLIELSPADYIRPTGRSDRCVTIEMTIFPGRSRTAKKNLYKAISEKLAMLGVPTGEILVVLNEPPMENWGVRGLPADEVDLGFSVKV